MSRPWVRHAVSVAAAAGFALTAAAAFAQQVTVGAPTHTINHSFFEGIGTSWGIRGNGFTFQFGGPQIPLPPAGQPDMGAGLTGGLAWIGPSATTHLNFHALQGSRSSMISQTPSVTLPNGGTAYIGDASMSPFVISVIPVVGGFAPMGFMGPEPIVPMPTNPWAAVASAADAERWATWQRIAAEHSARQRRDELPDPPAAEVNARAAIGTALPERLRASGSPPAGESSPSNRGPQPPDRGAEPIGLGGNNGSISSAELAVPSVAEAARLRDLERQARERELSAAFLRGEQARADGNYGAARVYYQMVAAKAEGDLKEAAKQRLAELSKARQP